MGTSIYNTPGRDTAVRKSIERWELSLGPPAETTALNWSAATENKIIATVVPSITPNGFDLFTTLEGAAIRFIGSGLGNGDTGNFKVSVGFSIKVNTGSGLCVFKGKTRPYTETVFANATDLDYIGASRNFSNNDLGNITLTPQIITLSDGDLVEFSANPTSNFSDTDLQWSGITIEEV